MNNVRPIDTTSGSLDNGHALLSVRSVSTPEPDTLGLLELGLLRNGVLGLVSVARRKLKLRV